MEFGLGRETQQQLKPTGLHPKRSGCCPTLCYGFLVVLWFAVNILSALFFIGFTIVGISTLSTDYSLIPHCAEDYRPWTIIMVLLYGLAFMAQCKRGINGFTIDLDNAASRSTILCILCILGIMTGTGYFSIHDKGHTCDTSRIGTLVTWVYRSIVYDLVLSCILLILWMYITYRAI